MIFYVATRVRYAIVEAANADEARELGHTELTEMVQREISADSLLVRPATFDEFDFIKWHHEKVAQEA